jgi:hypothetical protein
MEVSGQFHASVALPPEKEPQFPLDRGLGGPQSRSGRGVEKKNSYLPPGLEPRSSNRPARSLYRLSYPGSKWNHRQQVFILLKRDSSIIK